MQENHNLIITIINQGHSKMVMDAARSAGAGGGTVLNGLGTANQLAQFAGLNVSPEKEIVLIVASAEKTAQIVDAIKANAGQTTSAQGISFSLPVGDFTMLSNMLNNK